MDRIPADHPMYFGRPNTWGLRYANILMQQADLLVAFGTRLSLQQTGFNWQQFVPAGDVVQVDCDPQSSRRDIRRSRSRSGATPTRSSNSSRRHPPPGIRTG